MTKEDFDLLMKAISDIKTTLGINKTKQKKKVHDNTLFKEIVSKEYEGNKEEP